MAEPQEGASDPLARSLIARSQKSSSSTQNESHQLREAQRALEPISAKLNGYQVVALNERRSQPATIEAQVQSLIEDATSPYNLGSMYVGWCPHWVRSFVARDAADDGQ